MRLEDLSPDHVRRAVEIYRERAYRDPARRPALDPRLAAAKDRDAALAVFEDESYRASPDGSGLRRLSLRLGHAGYPHMKLALEENIALGEYFFTVDTHDEIDVAAHLPDAHLWLRLKDVNRALKEEIERAWADAGLPTYYDLGRLVCFVQDAPRRPGQRAIVVADDERTVADAVSSLLRERGYHVRTAPDGVECLRRVREDPPDLVLVDFEMPRMDGVAVCNELKRSPDTAGIQVLLATASPRPIWEMTVADGFLVKPYEFGILLGFVERLAGKAGPAADAGPGGAPARE